MSDSSFESRLDRASETVEAAKHTADAFKGKDRSAIAKLVIWLYAAAVLACFAFVLGGLWFLDACVVPLVGAPSVAAPASGCFAWKEPADYLLQVLTTAVLPIVTLVLGYYFGTAKSDGDLDG